jgi:predicted outer membrane repeat protein
MVYGNIGTNTTWSADTVKLIGNVTVMKGIVLTIEPGTYIESQGYCRINISGSIRALGTLTDTIVFTVKDTSGFWQNTYSADGGWGGINIADSIISTDTSIFEFCKIQYGKKYDSKNEDINGGAINAEGYGTLIIRNSYLSCNLVIRNGFVPDPASKGGAVYCNYVKSVLVSHNKFERNKSFNQGGAIYIGKHCQAEIKNNVFRFNTAWNWAIISGNFVCWGSGAAIETYDSEGPSPIISDNYCFNNYTIDGIIRSSNQEGLIYNNIVCNNSGIGISVSYYFSTVRIYNNTIVNNQTFSGGIYIYASARVYNNIVWGNINSPGDATDQIQKMVAGGTIHPLIYNNCVQYGNGGTNSINGYPAFTNPSSGVGFEYNGSDADWSLKDMSPCINTGTPDTAGLSIPEFDIFGNPRIFGGRIEIGSIENQNVLVGIKYTEDNKYSLLAFPNPGTVQLNINSHEQVAYIELIDISGQVIMQRNTGSGITSINTESLNPGIYYYRLLNLKKGVVASGKWIKRD